MVDFLENAVKAWKDLQDPKGKLPAEDATNAIVNNLELGEKKNN